MTLFWPTEIAGEAGTEAAITVHPADQREIVDNPGLEVDIIQERIPKKIVSENIMHRMKSEIGILAMELIHLLDGILDAKDQILQKGYHHQFVLQGIRKLIIH